MVGAILAMIESPRLSGRRQSAASAEGWRPSQRGRAHAGRNGSVEEALSRQSRYRTLKENLEIEGIMVSDREIRALYVLARNPLETEHDRCNRERTSMSSRGGPRISDARR